MFEDPYRVFDKLKEKSDYLNFQKRTVGTFFDDVAAAGLGATIEDRLAWGDMQMDPTDIADITGHIYTYLMNGQGPESGWTGLFKPGERVRLRFINASTMSYFNVRIPGLPLTVVEADGQPVRPVERRRVPDRGGRDLRSSSSRPRPIRPTRSSPSRSTAAATPAARWRRASA